MRLWSIHPQYLDKAGLTALWREGLLAQKVLRGETKGYRHHPQLIRFRAVDDPVAAIGYYLDQVSVEAEQRGFNYNRSKIITPLWAGKINVTRGQLAYELGWLLQKLQQRSPAQYLLLQEVNEPDPHPLFTVVNGGVETWEKI
ncbi:MAG: pyrimidine dimer DNA glycosylase/endonuclease V [Methylocystaceae bacterium]